jgi:transcription elongation factor SPT5
MSDFEDDKSESYESDFIDDDDASDDASDASVGRGGKRKKLKKTKSKKKNKKVKMGGNYFIEDQALEDSDEDELSGDDVPEYERKMAEEQRKKYMKEFEKKTHGPGFLEMEGEEEIDEYFKSNNRAEGGGEDELALLPTSHDPKLFAVKCKPNEERDACLSVMTKYFQCLGTPAEFEIFSAVAVDKTQGYIYIEAHSDKHVYMACASIPNIFASKVFLVQFADRTQIFEADPTKTAQIKIGQWVRVKKGVYENDLAQVQDIDEAKGRVYIKLVPRLVPPNEKDKAKDYADDEDEAAAAEENKRQRYAHLMKSKGPKIRPPQRLFQESEFGDLSTQRDAETGISFSMYKGNRYYDGLLYKWVPLKTLTTDNVSVTYEESKYFTIGENTNSAVLSALIEQAGSKATKYFKGDKIRAIRGEFMNLEGEIIKINPTSLIVKLLNSDLMESTEIATSDCVKAFTKGDYVRIIDGKNAGKEGFVLSVEDDNICTIMTDGLQNMVQVFVNDLVFCNESTRNIDVSSKKDKGSQPEYVKYDLVKLNDRKTIGIVLSTANAGWKILNNFGVVQNVTTYQIELKLNTRNNITRNDKNQTLKVGDSVRILQGKFKGQTGTIKHIYNDLLFIYNPDFIQNVGIVIEKANNAYLLSAQRTNGKGAGPKGGKDELLGKRCVIKTGPWKGYQGIVKDGNEKTVRLELTAKCQIIDVKRELVMLLSDVGKATEIQNNLADTAKTPMMNRFPQSPMFMNSPGFENSPAWGGFESPAYDAHLGK